MKQTALFCFFISVFFNIASYLFCIKYSVYFCIFMFFPLFITGAWFLITKEKKDKNISIFEEQNNTDNLQWNQFTEIEKSILLIITIVVASSFIYLIQALEYTVTQSGYSYNLMKKTKYIREATEAEYHLYIRRVCRLITGTFIFLSYLLFLSIKYKKLSDK